jgi:hypothetical protein
MVERVVHSKFKLLININEHCICLNNKTLKMCRSIGTNIFDHMEQGLMQQHKHCFKTIYDLLLNICDGINPFGRVTMVFGSGFC